MASIKEITLFSYYYSSASWRVRAVLTHKKIPFKYECVHLLDGKQHSEEFLKLNPMHQVPALKVVDKNDKTHILTQSLAIIQFIEDNYPEHPVIPKDHILAAKSRAIADTISGGIQPLQNLETLTKYTEPLGGEPLSQDGRVKVAQYWIVKKLGHLEQLVKKSSGKYCVGDELSIADFCLVPQMFNARRFKVDTSGFPTIKSIDERLQELDIFKSTSPLECPDAPKTN